jgi:hypothetical protein
MTFLRIVIRSILFMEHPFPKAGTHFGIMLSIELIEKAVRERELPRHRAPRACRIDAASASGKLTPILVERCKTWLIG